MARRRKSLKEGSILLMSFLFALITLDMAHQSSAAMENGELTSRTGLTENPQWEGSSEQKAFSEFNHHLGGVFVLFMGGLSLLEAVMKKTGALQQWWVRSLWPLSLLILGVYMMIASDRWAWPIGPMSLSETLSDPEVFQHKTFALIMIALGVLQLLQREQVLTGTMWNFLFFFLIIVQGALLLFHSPVMSTEHHSHHLLFNHLVMGVLALLAGGAKILHETRLWRWRYSAFVWPLLVLILGIQLLLYTE